MQPMNKILAVFFAIFLCSFAASADTISPLGKHSYFDFIFSIIQDTNRLDPASGNKIQAVNSSMLKYSLWNLLNERLDMLVEYGSSANYTAGSINNTLGVGLKVLMVSEGKTSDLSPDGKENSYGYSYDDYQDKYVRKIQDYVRDSSKQSFEFPLTVSGLLGVRSLTANLVNQGNMTGIQGYLGLKASKEITKEKSFTPYFSALYRNSNYSNTVSFGQIDFSVGLAASLLGGWGRVHSELTRQFITPTFENTYTIDQIAIAFESNF